MEATGHHDLHAHRHLPQLVAAQPVVGLDRVVALGDEGLRQKDHLPERHIYVCMHTEDHGG
jgi:hypothetical protein